MFFFFFFLVVDIALTRIIATTSYADAARAFSLLSLTLSLSLFYDAFVLLRRNRRRWSANKRKPHAAVNLYFSCQDGSVFKVQKKYAPYFMLATSSGSEHEVEAYVRRKHKEHVKEVELVDKEDLDLKTI